MGDARFLAPTDLGEAVSLLAQYGNKVTILAGGTDVVPKINYYDLKPEVLLYVGKLGLNTIKEVDGSLVIGAGATLAQILASELVAKHAPALVHAITQHSSVAIRSAATLGGNIANASPAADTVIPLIAMDATLRLVSAQGERTMPLQDFFTGPGESKLEPGELITEVHIPPTKGQVVYYKLGKRKAQACSIVVAAVRLQMAGGVCEDARIVLGSMAPTPIRCPKAEGMLAGKAVDQALVAQAAAVAVGESSPIDDVRATSWYRQKACTNVLVQLLSRAASLQS